MHRSKATAELGRGDLIRPPRLDPAKDETGRVHGDDLRHRGPTGDTQQVEAARLRVEEIRWGTSERLGEDRPPLDGACRPCVTDVPAADPGRLDELDAGDDHPPVAARTFSMRPSLARRIIAST